jgi:hypothetical protein
MITIREMITIKKIMTIADQDNNGIFLKLTSEGFFISYFVELSLA